MKDGPCEYCRGVRLVGWSGAGPILCPRCCEHNEDVFSVVTQAWREQRTRVVEFESELTTLRESNTALRAQLAAARVAVESAALPPLPLGSHYLAFVERANDIGEAQRKALAAVRRALGLEVGNG